MDSEAVPIPSRVAVAVDVAEDVAEVVADTLFTHGASAVAEQPGLDGRCTLVGDLAPEDLATLIADPLLGALGAELRVLEPDAAWNDGWREFARSWTCGDRVVLRPAWVARDPLLAERLADGSLVEVVIEPGHAFGSGSHATTRLCVARLPEVVEPGVRVLDVGCGTGVLGVADVLLGAGSVTALDIDPEARRVTRDLARRNDVSDRVDVVEVGLAEVDGTFDLVLANLLLPIIEALGADLAARVSPGGHLVASGVLVDQQDRAVAALAPLRLIASAAEDGWVTLVLTRP